MQAVTSHPMFLVLLFMTTATVAPCFADGDNQPVVVSDAAGHWEGYAEVDPLHFGWEMELSPEKKQWSGWLRVPYWGETHWPLSDVKVVGGKVWLTLKGFSGEGHFAGQIGSDGMSGTYTWKGRTNNVLLIKGYSTEVNEPYRNLDIPQPPFPYTKYKVSYKRDGLIIHGVLTVPTSKQKHAAVILVSGSGAYPGDEEVPGRLNSDVQPWIIADFLARKGLAVLRCDDRGAGDTQGDKSQATLVDLADDAIGGLQLLRSRDDVDPARAGIIGSSLGGLVGGLAAARCRDVAFLVLLASPATPGEQRSMAAHEIQENQLHTDPAERAARLKVWKKLLSLSETSLTAAQIRQRMVDEDAALLRAAHITRGEFGVFVNFMCTPLARFTASYDPRSTLRSLQIPVLFISAADDERVPSVTNTKEARQALAATPDATIKVIPGLSHSLSRESKTGDCMFDPGILDLLGTWIGNRFILGMRG